jgi:beta-glucosidase
MAVEVIRGMQGLDLTDGRYAMAIAGAKHFSGFDGPKNGGEAVISESDWLWNYTPHFEAAVVEGGAISLMCTYARSNLSKEATGQPHGGTYGCANHLALTSLLRERWKFSGWVVSDCGAVHDAVQSLTAGCDLECPFGHQSNAHFNELGNLSRAGAVGEAAIDVAVQRLLAARILLGEFDRKGVVPFRNASVYDAAKLAPALETLSEAAARQSLVLLQNQRHTLPLFAAHSGSTSSSAAKKVAVVGIESKVTAGYDTGGDGNVLTSTALQSARTPVGVGALQVTTAVGCEDGPSCEQYNSTDVIAAVENADAVLVFLGTGGEEGEMHDLHSLELKGKQTQLLLDAVAAAPKVASVVVVLLTCAPLNISLPLKHAGAVVQAFCEHQLPSLLPTLQRLSFRHK